MLNSIFVPSKRQTNRVEINSNLFKGYLSWRLTISWTGFNRPQPVPPPTMVNVNFFGQGSGQHSGGPSTMTITEGLFGINSTFELMIADPDDYWVALQNTFYWGDTIEVQAGYAQSELPLVNFGLFYVDTVNFSGPPDTVIIRCSRVPGYHASRSSRSRTWSGNPTIQSVLTAISTLDGFAPYQLPVNMPSQYMSYFQMPMSNLNQKEESDLHFLKRLGKNWGMALYVSSHPYGQAPSATNVASGVSYLNLLPYGYIDTYAAGVGSNSIPLLLRKKYDGLLDYSFAVDSQNVIPAKGKTITGDHNITTKSLVTGQAVDPMSNPQSQQYIRKKSTSNQQSQLQAVAAQRAASVLMADGNLTLVGMPIFRAGMGLFLEGFGQFDVLGGWTLARVTHHVSRQGYITELVLNRLLGDYTGQSGFSLQGVY